MGKTESSESVSSGAYFNQIDTEDYPATGKMLIWP